MEGDPAPGQALHVGHLGAFVDARLVFDLALEHGEYPGGSFLARSTGAHGRSSDLDAVPVNVGHLVIDADHHEHRA